MNLVNYTVMHEGNLCGLTSEEIFTVVEQWGYKLLHALSISNSIYKKRIGEISLFDNIPARLKILLNGNFNTGFFSPVRTETSSDRTEKYLFTTSDGKMLETVYIPDNKRKTACVSVQSGCRMGCVFCATAGYGYHGDLTAGEIVSQVLSIPHSGEITHVVLMGMGEPMDNSANVLKACNILTSEWGLSLSPRNVTVSTVGLMPGVVSFMSGCDCNLTLSLLSPFSEERRSMVPAEAKYPAKDIIEFLRFYPLKKKRRLSIAYVMMKDRNDTGRHLEELIRLVRGSGIRVNLLPYHPVRGDDMMPSSGERMIFFKHNLVISGISASIRRSRGADISAACGLLASGLG